MRRLLAFLFACLTTSAVMLPLAADTVCQTGCDHTTIQACVDSMTAGEFCEVRANTPGGNTDYLEFVNIDQNSGTLGNEIELYAREGDCVRIRSPNVATNSHIVTFDGVAHWVFRDFCGVGTGGYTHQPTPDANSHDQYGGLRFRNGTNNIDIRNNGTHDRNDDYAIHGGYFYAGNLLGNNDSGDDAHDGVFMIRFYNNSLQLSGTTNCETCSGGDTAWGDLLRIEAPQVVLERNTFYAGGHNTLENGEKWIVVKENIFDNDWTVYETGNDGYRVAALTAGDQGNFTKDITGDGLYEFNIFRNGLDGPDTGSGCVKYQTYRGVIRYNVVHNCPTQLLGMLTDLNNGEDGDVTEQKVYHETHVDVGTFHRLSEPVVLQCDQGGHGTDVPTAASSGTADNAATCDMLHEEDSYINFIVQDLGPGDNLAAGVYIYNHDETDLDGHPNGWKGREYRGITLDMDFDDFDIRLNDETGGAITETLTNALAGTGSATNWDDVFSNWDEETVTFSDPELNKVSPNWEAAFDAMRATGAASLTDVEPLTTMVGSGSSTTSGTLADGRFFAMPVTHWGIRSDWAEDDHIWIGNTRVQLTSLNKNTGAITFTPAASWSDGEDVFPDYNGDKPVIRGAAQPTATEITGPGRPMSPHL